MTALLQSAKASIASGDRESAMSALRSALKLANAEGDRRMSSCLFRAMNFTRRIAS